MRLDEEEGARYLGVLLVGPERGARMLTATIRRRPVCAAGNVSHRLALVFSLTAVWCLPGCQTFTLPVKYESPDMARPVAGSDAGVVTLFFSPVEDRRTRAIHSLNVCLKEFASTYQTDRSPVEIVHEALVTELSKSGVRMTSTVEGAQGTLRGQLKQFEHCTNDTSYTVDVHVDLYGTENAGVLWSGDLYARVIFSSGSSLSTDYERKVNIGFSRALTEAIPKVNQPSFTRALKSLAVGSPALPSGGASKPAAADVPPPIY